MNTGTSSAKVAALDRYKERILKLTECIIDPLGIPLPHEGHDADVFAPDIAFDALYIRLQAVEKRELVAAQKAADRELCPPGQSGRDALADAMYRATRDDSFEQHLTPIDPVEAVRKYERLLVLGNPGAGKSTVLRYLARSAIVNGETYIPVLVSLNRFTSENSEHLSLRAFAVRHAAPDDEPIRTALEQEADEGHILWLLDGLDEAPDKVGDITAQILNWHGRIVITSRPIDAVGSISYPHFKLLPLRPDDVKHFFEHWFQQLTLPPDVPPDWRETRLRWVTEQFQQRPHLTELTRNPLLLTFLAVSASQPDADSLPESRAQLYQQYIERLLMAWETRHRTDNLAIFTVAQQQQPEARRIALACFHYLGWALHFLYHGGKTDRLPDEPTLISILAGYLAKQREREQFKPKDIARSALAFWQHAGMLERRTVEKNELLTFRYHQTFQEFAAARVLLAIWHRDRRSARAFLKPRLHHVAWREPLLLLAGMMEQQDAEALIRFVLRAHSPYERILHRDLKLAAALIGELSACDLNLVAYTFSMLRSVSLEYISDAYTSMGIVGLTWLLDKLQKYNDGNNFPGVFYAIDALGYIRDIRAVDDLLVTLRNSKDWLVRSITADTLGRIGDLRALDGLLVTLCNDAEWYVRYKAVFALEQLGSEQAITGLKYALRDQHMSVRNKASEALSAISNRPSSSSVDYCCQDSSSSSLHHIISGIFKDRGFDESHMVEGLLEVILDGSSDCTDPYFCIKMLEEVRDRHAIDGLLVALQHSKEWIRILAAESLGNIGDTRAVHGLVKALHDDADTVRFSAVKALFRIGDPQALDGLLILLHDEQSDIRKLAISVIGEMGDQRVVDELLKVLRDRDETIRIHVITALVKIYERHSDILSITRLYQCARVQVNDDLANLLVVLETRARPVTDPLLPLPKQAQALQHFMKYWYILAVVATDVLVNLVAGIFVNEYIESKVAWVVGGIAIFLIAVIVYIVQVNHDQRQQAAADANEIALLAEDF